MLGCSDTLSSDGGGLAITAQLSESAANASFDAARIRIIGPTNRTVNTTPGAEEVIEGLAPGQYQVVLEGLEGSDVELFGQQSGVTVSAGNVTDVTITFSSFIPAFSTIPTTAPTLQFEVIVSAVPGAAGYVFEWDTNASFTNPRLIAVVGRTNATIPGVQGDVYVRVRAASAFGTFSVASEVRQVDVDPVVAAVGVTPADLDTLIGQGDTVQFSATTMDANGDEFSGPGFTWASSDEAIGIVDTEGRVVAVGNGTTDISATSNGIQGHGSFTAATLRADSGLYFPYSAPVTAMTLYWDGSRYLYMNGGGAASGRLMSYDEQGTLLDSLVVNADLRSLHYRAADDTYYAKTFGLNWLSIDIETGDTTLLETGIFLDSQSSPALTPDGSTIIEHAGDSIQFIDFMTKQPTFGWAGLGPATNGYRSGVATDGNLIFIWYVPATVFVYDYQGRFVTTFDLPVTIDGGGAGYSLSYTNGMLWVANDGTPNPPELWHGFVLTQVDPAAPRPPRLAGIQSDVATLRDGRPCQNDSTTICR